MVAIIGILIPLFTLIGVGYLAGRLRRVPDETGPALSAYVFRLALPVFVVDALSQVTADDLWDPPFLATMTLGSLGTLLLVIAFGRKLHAGRRVMAADVAIFPNSLFLGYPAVLAVVGVEFAAPVAIASVFHFVVPLLSGIVLLVATGAIGRVWSAARSELLFSPFVWATAVGLFLALSGIRLPDPAMEFVHLVSASAGPVALVALGLFMGTHRKSFLAPVPGWVTAAKLVLHPMLTAAGAMALGLGPEMQVIAVLMAAMPPAVGSFLLAERYRAGADDAALAIVLATVLAAATIPLTAALMT